MSDALPARQAEQITATVLFADVTGFSQLSAKAGHGHFEVRRVSSCGTFRLSGQYFLSNALKGENIGLEDVGDDVWNIVYYNTVLGRIDLKTSKITGSENV